MRRAAAIALCVVLRTLPSDASSAMTRTSLMLVLPSDDLGLVGQLGYELRDAGDLGTGFALRGRCELPILRGERRIPRELAQLLDVELLAFGLHDGRQRRETHALVVLEAAIGLLRVHAG